MNDDQTTSATGLPAPIAAVDLAQRIDPEVGKVYDFAKLMAGCPFLPDRIRNDPRAIFFMVMTGREMGLTMTHAIRSLYVTPEGRVGIQGDIAEALLLSKGFRIIWKKSTPEVAACIIRRPSCQCEDAQLPTEPGTSCACGNSFCDEFTRKDADDAGITKARDGGVKYNWKSYPKVMLRWRALLQTGRIIAGDLLGGIYTPDELDEIMAQAPADNHRPAEPIPDSLIPAELQSAVMAAAGPTRQEEAYCKLRSIADFARDCMDPGDESTQQSVKSQCDTAIAELGGEKPKRRKPKPMELARAADAVQPGPVAVGTSLYTDRGIEIPEVSQQVAPDEEFPDVLS